MRQGEVLLLRVRWACGRHRSSFTKDIGLRYIVELPADFTVWALSDEARFLKGRLVWANWDVDELKARGSEIEKAGIFTVAIEGWPFGKVVQ